MSKSLITEPGQNYFYDNDGKRVCSGAKMGVFQYLPVDRNVSVKMQLQLEYVSNDGYLRTGHYVGLGDPFYVAMSVEEVPCVASKDDRKILMVCRAASRGLAKRNIRAFLPNARFYR